MGPASHGIRARSHGLRAWPDRTDAELWKALEALAVDPLDPAMPREVLDDLVRRSGAEPDAIRARGAEFVAKLREEHRLAWQVEARRRRDRMEERARNVNVPRDLSKDEVLRRLNELRRNPKLGAPISVAFRKRKPEESTDEELRMLLEDVEELRALEEDDDANGGREE